MKSKSKYGIFLFVGALLLSSLFNNCSKVSHPPGHEKLQGTNTGNPGPHVSSKILDSVCKIVSSCHSQVQYEKCQSDLLLTAGFAPALGLPSTYSSLSSILQAEASGTLVGNSAAGDSCSTGVQALSCLDPSVQAAYNPVLSDPFADSPGLLSSSSCQQAFSKSLNLEVPIELVDYGVASATVAQTFSRTRTSFDPNAYDGTVTEAFEIVATNTDSTSHSVFLVDSSDSIVGSISVPAVTTEPTRLRNSFSPTAGASDYRIRLEGTNPAEQLTVSAARILVQQVGATRTKIYVPLTAAYPGNFSAADDATAAVTPVQGGSYSQGRPHHFARWRKNNAAFSELVTGNAWTLEAVLSTSTTGSGTALASLFNATTGQQVTASEISTISTAPALVSVSFADSAAHFSDLNDFEVRINTIGNAAYLYRSGLWITLTNLTHAEVTYRTSPALWQGPTAGRRQWNWNTVLFDPSRFTAPTVFHEATGYLSVLNTPCTEQAFDLGTSDTGLSGSPVAGSALTFTSINKSRQRSQALAITAGNRVISETLANPSAGDCVVISPALVIGF